MVRCVRLLICSLILGSFFGMFAHLFIHLFARLIVCSLIVSSPVNLLVSFVHSFLLYSIANLVMLCPYMVRTGGTGTNGRMYERNHEYFGTDESL